MPKTEQGFLHNVVTPAFLSSARSVPGRPPVL